MGRIERSFLKLNNIALADQAQLGLIAANLTAEDERSGGARKFKWPGALLCILRAGTLADLCARVEAGRDRAALAETAARPAFCEPALLVKVKAAASAAGVLVKHLPRLALAGVPPADRERIAFEGYRALCAADEAAGVTGGRRRGRVALGKAKPGERRRSRGQTYIPALSEADRAELASIGEMLAIEDRRSGGVLQPDGTSLPFGPPRTLFAILGGMDDAALLEAVVRGKAIPGAGGGPWTRAHTEPDLRDRLRRLAKVAEVESRSLPGLALAGTPKNLWPGLALAGMYALQDAARVELAA